MYLYAELYHILFLISDGICIKQLEDASGQLVPEDEIVEFIADYQSGGKTLDGFKLKDLISVYISIEKNVAKLSIGDTCNDADHSAYTDFILNLKASANINRKT